MTGQSKMSSKHGAMTVGAVPGVAVLEFGFEGAAKFNQWVKTLIRALLISHNGLGDWWTDGEYEALEVYVHEVEVPTVLGPDGIGQVAMPVTDAKEYRKEIRKSRVSEVARAKVIRKQDLSQVYAKLLCLFTREGIDQIQDLP